MSERTVQRGAIWWENLNPTKGSEQRGHRPVLVVSSDRLHEIPIGLVWILPLTTSDYGVPNHVEVAPAEVGLPETSFVMCEQIRTIDTERLDEKIGDAPEAKMDEIDQKVRWLMKG